ncbi:MAG TPA: glycosyltransferase [Rhodanobacteraceae bacterium]|nr:glycosyltransferase [Rhodanobacteraceae bacterium]
MTSALEIVILGLSMRSSWGNGHATTYRALTRALRKRGHQVRFLERDVQWYADNEDAPGDLEACIELYGSVEQLRDERANDIAQADLVVVGSYVPDGIEIGEWVQRSARGTVAFYDIDTPVTLAKLEAGRCDYLHPRLIAGYDLYLSFTGGPVLDTLRVRYGAHAVPFYCAVDPERYAPTPMPPRYDLGYMGTYSADRQPALESLLIGPARDWPAGRFIVAGPQYPRGIEWPDNVHRVEHLGPDEHPEFYNAQRFTLNVTRADMVAAGWSPSVRLFEAAACGTPIISDAWPGLDTLFEPGREILIAREARQVLYWLRDMPSKRRRAIGAAARARVLAGHTAAHRAQALERYLDRVARRSTAARSRRQVA